MRCGESGAGRTSRSKKGAGACERLGLLGRRDGGKAYHKTTVGGIYATGLQ